MKQITIKLNDSQYDKLMKLAESRTKLSGGKKKYTIERCIQDFAKSCVTDGGGWKHPNVHAQEHEAKEKGVIPSPTP